VRLPTSIVASDGFRIRVAKHPPGDTPNDIVAQGGDKGSPASRLHLSPLLGETREADQINRTNKHVLPTSFNTLYLFTLWKRLPPFSVTQGNLWLATRFVKKDKKLSVTRLLFLRSPSLPSPPSILEWA
jgi:hypothetical protein